MKIVPSDVDVSICLDKVYVVSWLRQTSKQLIPFSLLRQSEADYWLLSDAEVSITDMWRMDCILLFSCAGWFVLSASPS